MSSVPTPSFGSAGQNFIRNHLGNCPAPPVQVSGVQNKTYWHLVTSAISPASEKENLNATCVCLVPKLYFWNILTTDFIYRCTKKYCQHTGKCEANFCRGSAPVSTQNDTFARVVPVAGWFTNDSASVHVYRHLGGKLNKSL